MGANPRPPALDTAPVNKLIWTFSLPAICSQVVSSMNNIVDQTFMGWGIGDLAIAAANVAFPVFTLITALACLIGIGCASVVIRGLIGVLRGDDQRMYFKMICFDMRQIEQNNLKKEAAKRPKKIQRYSMMMLICIMIIYLVVLCTEVLASLGAFFG